MERSVDKNPCHDDDKEEMELREMAECRELDVEDDNDRKKR